MIDRQTDRHTYIHIYRQTDRQTDRTDMELVDKETTLPGTMLLFHLWANYFYPNTRTVLQH